MDGRRVYKRAVEEMGLKSSEKHEKRLLPLEDLRGFFITQAWSDLKERTEKRGKGALVIGKRL